MRSPDGWGALSGAGLLLDGHEQGFDDEDLDQVSAVVDPGGGLPQTPPQTDARGSPKLRASEEHT